MENNTENLDSLNEEMENADSLNGDLGEPDLDTLKKNNEDLSGKNKHLFERAKKSETEVKELREQLKRLSGDKDIEKPQSNEPDYAKLAFLESKGISHPDDQKIIQDEASRLKLPLTDILAMEHIKTRLASQKDQREAQAGMPKGKGTNSGKTQQDVDYWLAKGETPDDLDLAEKVIEAKMLQVKKANKFSDELY
jgi:hypothetical protein